MCNVCVLMCEIYLYSFLPLNLLPQILQSFFSFDNSFLLLCIRIRKANFITCLGLSVRYEINKSSFKKITHQDLVLENVCRIPNPCQGNPNVTIRT